MGLGIRMPVVLKASIMSTPSPTLNPQIVEPTLTLNPRFKPDLNEQHYTLTASQDLTRRPRITVRSQRGQNPTHNSERPHRKYGFVASFPDRPYVQSPKPLLQILLHVKPNLHP